MERLVLKRLALAAAALALLLGGCSAPEPRACSVSCSAAGACPDGTTCGPDQLCYAPGQALGSCATAGDGDGDTGDSGDNGDGGDGDGDSGDGDGGDGAKVDAGDGDGGDGGDGDGGDGDGGDSGDGDGGEVDAGPPPCDPCDPDQQCGCDAQEGCYVDDGGDPVCLPDGSGRQDDPCTSDTGCAAGFDCVDGGAGGDHCQAYCQGDGGCPGAFNLCNREVGGGPQRVCTSNCDPLDSSACGLLENCVLSIGEGGRYDANCLEHGGLGYLDDCVDQLDCGPGLVCVETDSFGGLCYDLCDTSSTDCGAAPCESFSPAAVLGGVEYGFCDDLGG